MQHTHIVYICFIWGALVLYNGGVTADCEKPLITCAKIISFSLVDEKTKSWLPLKLDDDGASIRGANFQRYEAIKFLIMNRDIFVDRNQLLKNLIDAYVSLGLNVIVLDYSKVASAECLKETLYPSIPLIGECAARLLDSVLAVRRDIQLPQIHVIAFDDGVHVASYMAEQLKSGTIGRLTALEPIQIHVAKVSQLLNKKSAHFVDVYYTNSEVTSVENSDAHLEVYFNNGVVQEACIKAQDPMDCSHAMVILYFTESITSHQAYYGTKCTQRFWNGCHLEVAAPLRQVGEYAAAPNTCVSYLQHVYTMLTKNEPPYSYGYARPRGTSTVTPISNEFFKKNVVLQN